MSENVRKDPTSFLPPLAMAAVVAMTAAPGLASGAGNNTNSAIGFDTTVSDGYYYNVQAPVPSLGSGMRAWTNNRIFVNRGAFWFNGVGYYTFDDPANRQAAYQISDTGGNYIYYLTQGYAPYDANGNRNTLSAGAWRNSGTSWHFNWWGPGYNVGVDATNTQGANNPDEVALGAEGWGGCVNIYPTTGFWYWIYRNRNNGFWYFVPATAIYNWGNSPTWKVGGLLANNGPMAVGTDTCP